MARKHRDHRQPLRMQRFADPSAEVVWAGVMALDVALQHQLLRELATEIATRPVTPVRGTLNRIRVVVASLWEVYDLLGHSPSVGEYKGIRENFPELELPPGSNITQWLGCGWPEALRRCLLPQAADGDFAYAALEHPFTKDELIDLVLACAEELPIRPSRAAFFAWAKRPDVVERFEGRLPGSTYPFKQFGGWPKIVEAAGVAAADRGLDSAILHTIPRIYSFERHEMIAALQDVIERLRERIGDRSPRTAEYDRERLVMHREWVDAGVRRALPRAQTIFKEFGSWDAALVEAGLKPLGGSGTKSNHSPRGSRFTREDKAQALRDAFAAIGNPFVEERYDGWRLGEIAEAEIEGRVLRIPSRKVIRNEFGGWRRACLENVDGYDPN